MFLLDWLIAALAIAGIAMMCGAGFTISVGGVSIAAHNVYRVAMALLVLGSWRWLKFRSRPFLGVSIDTLRRLARRAYRPQIAPPLDRRPTRLAHVAWAALGLCAVGTIILREQLMQMHAVPDPGDPLFSIWRMGWVFHYLQGATGSLFDTNIFYPHHLTLTYSDSMLLPALAAAPFFWAGVPPVLIYNGMFVACFLLSGLAMFMLVARITGSRQAAFLSAVIFAFYPYRFEHYSHFELQMTMWMPLGLLALHRFVATARLRDAIGVAACLVAQLYSSMYYGVFFVLYLVPVTAVLIGRRWAAWRRLLTGAIVAGVIAAIAAIPLVRIYAAARSGKGDRDIPEVTYYSATPGDYFEATGRSVLYGQIIRSHNPERALFPGAMTLTGAIVGLAPPWGPLSVIYGAALAASWELSLGFHGRIYPFLYAWFSPMRGLRVPARFSILVGMTLAILFGLGARGMLARLSTPSKRRVLLVALTVLLTIDLLPHVDLEDVWSAPPPIYQSLPRTPNVVLAEFPVRQHLRYTTESAPFMYFSVWHWTKMVNGYSGFFPKDYEAFVDQIEAIPAAGAADAMQAAGVTHVTVNCALYASVEGCTELMQDVDRSPRFNRIVRVQWHGAPVALYELRR